VYFHPHDSRRDQRKKCDCFATLKAISVFVSGSFILHVKRTGLKKVQRSFAHAIFVNVSLTVIEGYVSL
jgi:hypothetical protein